jgi:hypothetical protein
MAIPGKILSVDMNDSTDLLGGTCVVTFTRMPTVAGTVAHLTDLTTGYDFGNNPVKINDRVRVSVNYNGLDYDIFSGYVTHNDDLETAEQQTYSVTLSAIPPTQPHSQGISFLLSSPDKDGQLTTAHKILQSCAKVAGMQLTTIAIPDYTVYGTIEYSNVSLLDVLNEFIRPFNYPFAKMYVKYDEQGNLGIYEQKYNVTPFSPAFIESREKSCERYFVGKRLGTSNIMLRGGDYFNYTDDTESGKRDRGKDDNGANEVISTQTYTFEEVFEDFGTADNRNMFTGNLALLVYYVTRRTVQFKVQLTKKGEGELPNTIGSLAAVKNALQTGLADSANIIESVPVKVIAEQSTPTEGLQSRTTTIYNYQTIKFGEQLLGDGSDGDDPKECNTGLKIDRNRRREVNGSKVLVYEDTTEVKFFNNQQLPYSRNVSWYTYTDIGSSGAKWTRPYIWFRDQWIGLDTKIEVGGWQEYTTAMIQFYNNLKAGGFDVSTNTPNSTDSKNINRGLDKAKRPTIEEYRTLNGAPVRTENYKTADECPDIPDVNLPPGNIGLEISVPYAGYDGLALAYAKALQEKEHESPSASWEITTYNILLDPSLCVGFGGIDSISHSLTGKSATTTLVVRSIVK